MVWATGTVLKGTYQIEGELSRQGGFGMTYRARHLILNNMVVIKSPHLYRQNEPNYEDFVACFKREGQNLAKLAKKQHPNIVRVLDFFYEGSVPCLVMDYINGQTVEAIILQSKETSQIIPEETIVHWIVTIAEALDRVHELGLVHRDATPANIIINQNNEAFLIDFGIALNIQPCATTTIAGFAGHKDFAPLEQLESDDENSDSATARSPQLDVYCLAATLYFAMTREFPKGAYSRIISLNRKKKDSLIPPQTIVPTISDRINNAILSGMEMDTDDRPASMKDWIRLLTTDEGLLNKITPPAIESLPIAPLKFTTIKVYEKAEIIAELEYSVQAFDEILNDETNLKIIIIPGGSFMMGAPEDELGSYDDEKPKHPVTVSSFAIGQTLITQDQWKMISSLPKIKLKLNPSPSFHSGSDLPVERVNWFEAVEFCDRLTRLTRKPYRLPSEAEWEYACRAGTTSAFNIGPTIATDFANYRGVDDVRAEITYFGNYGDAPNGIYRGKTTDVSSFPPNQNSLYDMHGNVWEWCSDHWHPSYENAPIDGSVWLNQESDEDADCVLRGGSWFNSPHDCRSAIRNFNTPGNRDGTVGFRVLLPLSPSGGI